MLGTVTHARQSWHAGGCATTLIVQHHPGQHQGVGDVEMEVGKGAGGDGGSIGRCGERTDRQTDRDMKE